MAQLCFPSLWVFLAVQSPTGMFLKGQAPMEDLGAHSDFCHASCAPGSHWWVSPRQCQEQLLRRVKRKCTAQSNCNQICEAKEMGLCTWTQALLSLTQAFGFTIVKIALEHRRTKKKRDTKTLNLNLPTHLQCCRHLLWLLEGPDLGVPFLPEYSA